ncbi:MAG: YfhO family protein [Clostridiales bacterium]|nr:YfhO family protein [Clostridiales bacterium]
MKELSSLDSKASGKKEVKPLLKTSARSSGKSDIRPLVTFFITVALYITAMLLCNKYPLGKYTFLHSDLRAQYAPFLALLKNKIAELNSIPQGSFLSYLSYSFKLGLGKNFIGTFGYYLASPFNLIYLFIDEAQIDLTVLVIVTLKLSLSASFMCLFLGSRTEDKKTRWPVLLGIMYAFSFYSQTYIFQIMWLDGYMLLPLILYFTEKFIKKQNYAGLVISLLVLFISNYYIAYMVGIACFLYLIIRMIALKIPVKQALGTGIRFVLAAGFTALITAVMLVPVGLDTIRNADQTVSTRGEDVITYNPLTLIHMMLLGEPGEFSDILSGNYPFLFISLLVSLLLLVYFISPVYKGRERKIHAFCLLGTLLSTAVYIIDKAWQVFDDPNWFWHRHVFVFLPLFLVITFRVLAKIKEVKRFDIAKAMFIMYGLVIIDCSFGTLRGHSEATFANMILITVYAAIMAGFGIKEWTNQLRDMPKMLAPILAMIIVFELLFVEPMYSSGIQCMTLYGGPATEYSDSIRAEMEYGAYAKNLSVQTGAFRAESEQAPEYTEKYYVDEGNALYGNYNGLSFFNSNSNKKMQRFVKQLGLPANYNYFAVGHSFACPSVDAFFSIGSVAAKRDLSFYRFDGTDSYDAGLKFYANEDVLPLAFAADKGAMNYDFYKLEKDADEKNYYMLHNEWYRSMFPEQFEDDFFIVIDENVTGAPKITNGISFNKSEYMTNETFINRNKPSGSTPVKADFDDPLGLESSVAGQLRDNMTTLYSENQNIPIAVEYEFEAPAEDEIYCALVTGRILDGTEVYVNGIRISDFSSTTYYSQIFRVGSFKKGEKVKVSFLSDEKSWSYLNIRFACFDAEAFSTQFAKVDRSKVVTDVVSDGFAKFNIKGAAEDDIVITTIPEEDGWQLYIDGEKADHMVYQNAFIAFDPGEGDHTAELVFTAPGLKPGAAVSALGVVLLAAFIFVDKKRSKMKEKQ